MRSCDESRDPNQRYDGYLYSLITSHYSTTEIFAFGENSYASASIRPTKSFLLVMPVT